MSDTPETAPAAEPPPLPELVMPEIKITDENAVTVAASRLRVIRDQYAPQLGVASGLGVEATLLIRQQFRHEIDDVVHLLDRAWNALHPEGQTTPEKTAQPE